MTETQGFTDLKRLGMASWSAIGIILLVTLIAGGVSALSGFLVPFVIAIILGTLFEPVVIWLTRVRVPHTLATVIVLLAAIALAVGIAMIVVQGFIQQLPEIAAQLLNGWRYIVDWGRSLDLDVAWLEQIRTLVAGYIPKLSSGALGVVMSTVSGAISFAMGTFFALYFLFFVLHDGRLFPAWFAKITGRDAELVQEIDTEVRRSLLGYFRGTALTAIITAPIFVIPLLLLKIPLVVPIMILYFFLSFVPYIGAWITGAFAILIAFGFGGGTAALIVALSLLVSNGTVQSTVSSWALGTSLKLHPVAVLLATLIGGVIAGMLGMVLGPPLLAATQKAFTAVRNYRQRTPSAELS